MLHDWHEWLKSRRCAGISGDYGLFGLATGRQRSYGRVRFSTEHRARVRDRAASGARRGLSVLVPELPSVATQGETIEEAKEMAKEAIETYLEVMHEDGLPIPTVRSSVAVDVA